MLIFSWLDCNSKASFLASRYVKLDHMLGVEAYCYLQQTYNDNVITLCKQT